MVLREQSLRETVATAVRITRIHAEHEMCIRDRIMNESEVFFMAASCVKMEG